MPISLAESFGDNPVSQSAEEPVEEAIVDETEGNIEESTEDVSEEVAEETAEEPSRTKFSYKRGDEDIEEDLTDEEVLMRVSRYRNAEERAREVAEKEKKINEIQETLQKQYEALKGAKDDPVALLKSLGVDFDDIAKKHALKQYEIDQMSPEERESYNNKIKLQDLEAKEKRRIEEDALRKRHEEDEKALNEYNAWGEALADKSGLKEFRYAKNMFFGEFANNRDKSNEELMDIVKKNFVEDTSNYIASLPQDQIMDTLGKDTVYKIVKAYSATKPKSNIIKGKSVSKKSKQDKFFSDLDSAFEAS